MTSTATPATAQSARRSQMRHSRDPDAVTAMLISMTRLAIADYLAGPGPGHSAEALVQQRNYASAEAFLLRTGLLERVHERHGTPAYLSIGYDQQLELF